MRRHDDEDLTPEEFAELGALLVAERPRPSATFAAELDARVEARFAQPAASRAPNRWLAVLHRPFLPAAAGGLAVGLVAVVVALNVGGSSPSGGGVVSLESPPSVSSNSSAGSGTAGSAAQPATGTAGGTTADSAKPLPETDQAAPPTDAFSEQADSAAAPDRAAKRVAPHVPTAGSIDSRKVERSASIELGTARDRIDDVAQDVLGTVARFGGIVDQSSVASGADGGGAQFALRIPSARLQPALAALSRLPDTHVLARSDDQQDVNQAYVSIRRRLADATAERAGVLRALAAANSGDETLRLRYRLDAIERTIAQTERAQRGLDRRIDFSTVTLSIRGDGDEGSGGAGTSFTIGRAFRDAGRVLEVAGGVVVIAAAALVPLALLLACTLPLAHVLRRRRREQALDAT